MTKIGMSLQGWRASSRLVSIVGLCLVATACSSVLRTAPIVDRSTGGSKPVSPPAATAPVVRSAPTAAPQPTSEPSGPNYSVKKGDTLYSIALEHGQDYREIAAWNQLDDANVIRIGQTLRVAPPEGVQATPVVAMPTLESKPLTATPLPPVAANPVVAGNGAKPETKVAPVSAHPSESGTLAWSWPSAGAVTESFVEGRNKGIDIAGKAGDPVSAASDGKVVYAGNGLRGYGNLVIIKHNNDYLSAYAHNSKILVKEGESVKRGSKIAEVGNSDADRTKLHFEVRRQGKPVDPLKYLPER